MSDKTDEPEDEAVGQSSSSSEHPIDPIEGTSSAVSNEGPIDEFSNDSTPSSSVLKPGEAADCETCQKTAILKVFHQRVPLNGGKTEDILRNFCETCGQFFGLCSKKVRGAFTFTTEEGRILTNSEKMEIQRDRKRKASVTRKNSTEGLETEPSNSDTSTNGASEEKEEEDLNIGKVNEKSPRKKPPFPAKRKKTNWTSIKKRGQKVKLAKAEVPTTSSVKKPPPSTSKKGKVNESPKEVKPPANVSPIKQRPGRPPGKAKPSIVVVTKEIPVMVEKKAVGTSEVEVQTDADLLLKAACFEDTFNETLNGNLSEQVSERLKEQPMIVKKQFVMMIRTIKEQETVINNLKKMEENYQDAIKKLKDFGRNTRLTFSDSFRSIRADMVERKEEFKAHQAEVISIMKKQKTKYEAYKSDMMKKYDDFQLEKTNLEAKIAYLEQEKNYEKDRAAFYLRTRDVYEKERNEAQETAETAVKNLNDRLYVTNNEFCAHCQVNNKLRKKMTAEVAEMTAKTEKATNERNEMEEKAKLFESAAQRLGKDCDAIKYERDSWKAYAERFKKENNKLTQKVKALTEKEKEVTEKVAEVMATPKSTSTPRSVACTPNETDRVSPPEEGEIVDTPPQNSPVVATSNTKPVVKPLAQKIAEKKVASVPIASGFESWIPKEKLNEPAPEIPKALSAFGAPIKTPQQREAEKARMAPSLQPTPWEKAAMGSVPASDSLAEALNKVQADSFFGGAAPGSTPTYSSKSYQDEINRAMNARKRTSDVVAEPPKKATPTPAPAPKKIKSTTPSEATTPSSYKSIAPAAVATPAAVSSLGAMKKIPKLSDKPPQAEFAPALGVKSSDDNGGIPGFGMLEETAKEKTDTPRKILPVEPKPKPAESHQNSNQKGNYPNSNKHNMAPKKKKNSPPNKMHNHRQDNFSASPWHRPESSPAPPWSHPQQNQYGIQSSSRGGGRFQMDYDRPWTDSVNQDREQFGTLPWHRTQDTPFGKVPIQDSFSMGPPRGPPMGMGMPMRGMAPQERPSPMGFYNNPPRDNGPGFYSNSHNQYSPPNAAGRGNPRSFYS